MNKLNKSYVSITWTHSFSGDIVGKKGIPQCVRGMKKKLARRRRVLDKYTPKKRRLQI